MKNNQININNYYQLNQFQNSLNLKVIRNKNFDNEMIDYGVIIINKADNLMNSENDRAKYIADSFYSKYPQKGKHWNCFILPLSYTGCNYYSIYDIWYSTGKERILIFGY
jgi:hypothetical protein